MPRKDDQLSWEGHPHYRWVKMFRGVRYRVKCSDLTIPRDRWTKEASYQAANTWWLKRRAELEGQQDADRPHADALALLARRLDHSERHGLHREADALREQIEAVRVTPAADTPITDPTLEARIEAARLLGITIPDDTDPTALDMLLGSSRIWADRMAREQTVPTERTIGALVNRWVAIKADEARKGVRSAGGADNIRNVMTHFTTFVGPASSVEVIDADLWHRWYVHCQAMLAKRDDDPQAGWSADYASMVFITARSFVKWLWEREVIANLPRNIDSSKHKFERPDDDIPTFTDDEINRLLTASTGQMRLHLLLMLNTGMTQKDISDLRKGQIDLEAGTIRRRRSKTKKKKKTPIVRYTLWPATLRLLREHLSDDPIIALLTKSKARWVWAMMQDNGKMKRSDNIATNYTRIRDKAGLDREGHSLKVFRKTSATRIGENTNYLHLRHFFLGHKEKMMADKHYVAKSQRQLDRAIAWLGRQYGLITAPGSRLN